MTFNIIKEMFYHGVRNDVSNPVGVIQCLKSNAGNKCGPVITQGRAPTVAWVDRGVDLQRQVRPAAVRVPLQL